MAEVNYARMVNLLATTLDTYLGRPGSKFSLVTECATKNVVAGRLFRRTKLDVKGGVNVRWPVQFNRAEIAEWVGPYHKGTLRGTRPPTWGSVPRRYLAWFVFKSWVELELNEGDERAQIIDTARLFKSDIAVALVDRLESAMMAKDGNYLHDDSQESDFLLPFGLKYWCTLDGLHVTGNTTKTVGGINPNTYTLWKNPYINPVASSDGLGPIANILQLRPALERMMRLMRFDDLSAWGPVAKDAQGVEPADPDGRDRPDDLVIVCDAGTDVQFREVLFDRQDNVGFDQGLRRPIYKGIEIMSSDQLGMGAYGYGRDDANADLWVDRGGSYANGNWAGYGETLRRSRRRGLGYIGPYALAA